MSARIAIDANVLVYAFVPSSRDHVVVRDWLDARLADPRRLVAVTGPVISEVVHLITDTRRYDPAASMNDATALVRELVEAPNVECLDVDPATVRLALNLLDRHRLGRNRVNDAFLAASCLAHGVDELATCNPKDFRIFPLTIIDPTE